MGMYTGLRGKVWLKEEYAEKISSGLSLEGYFEWEEILPESNKYNHYPRNSFIPFGRICYLDWEETSVKIEDSVLSFSCSLKNYNDTISTFVEECLPEIAFKWELEEQYEEEEFPTKIVHEG